MAISIAARPSIGVTQGAQPVRSASVGSRPSVAESMSPAGSIPEAWIQTPTGSGEAILQVTSDAEMFALIVIPAQEALLAFEADALVEAVGGYLESTGEGLMPLAAEAAVLPVVTYSGDSELTLESEATTSSEIKLLPMGMDKTGSQAIGTNDGNVKITGWTARAGSTITNNELVSSTGGAATVTARITNEGSPAGQSHTIAVDLMHNDTVIATQTGTGVDRTLTANVTLAAGSRIWVRADVTATYNAARSILAPNTYVSWIAAT